jgi:hypothetical protein
VFRSEIFFKSWANVNLGSRQASRYYDLDKLPVNFGSTLLKDDLESAAINYHAWRDEAITGHYLAWRGFCFRQKGTKVEKLTYIYHCRQDSVREKEMIDKVGRKRDDRRMQGFPCKSKLTMRVSLQDRTLFLCMYHVYHRPYQDLQLSPAARCDRVHWYTRHELDSIGTLPRPFSFQSPQYAVSNYGKWDYMATRRYSLLIDTALAEINYRAILQLSFW